VSGGAGVHSAAVDPEVPLHASERRAIAAIEYPARINDP
jgi:hypothetical protein